MGRHRLAAAGALPLLLALAACSGAATPSPATPSPAAPSAPAASPSSAASAAQSSSASGSSETYELKVGSGSVGSYLTGEDGKTLYVFKKDTANSGTSACTGGCAQNWPPFEADDLDEVKPDSGVTGKLALITRDDGSKQVTYNGLPLYYFAGDKAAGDTNGASIANWAVATP